jgi:hypothetical protein
VPASVQVCKAVSGLNLERLTLGFSGGVVPQEGGHGRGDSTGVAGIGHDVLGWTACMDVEERCKVGLDNEVARRGCGRWQGRDGFTLPQRLRQRLARSQPLSANKVHRRLSFTSPRAWS